MVLAFSVGLAMSNALKNISFLRKKKVNTFIQCLAAGFSRENQLQILLSLY